MKLGKLSIYRDGKIVIGPQPSKLLITVLLLSVPVIILFSFAQFAFVPYTMNIPVYVIISLTYILSVYQTIKTGIIDPGIVPSIVHSTQIVKANIYPNLEKTQSDNQFYMFLTQPHASRVPFHINKLSYRLSSRFCQTCKFFKPQRSTHSSRSDFCIQRYDHYCFWLGHDIGLLNHWDFYKMNFYILIFIGFCAFFAILEIAFSLVQIFTTQPTWQLWVAFACGLVVMGLFCYFCYSMGQLLQFHFKLLQTGSLTKEDLGSREHNFQYTAMYNKFSVKANFLEVRKNAKCGSLLWRMLAFLKVVEAKAKELKTIGELEKYFREQLLKLDGQSIVDIVSPVLPALDDDESQNSNSDRFAPFFKPGWDKQEVEKMVRVMGVLAPADCVVPYLCDLYALRTGAEFVVNNTSTVEQWKKDNTAYLMQTQKKLLLTCGSSKATAPIQMHPAKLEPGVDPLEPRNTGDVDIKTVQKEAFAQVAQVQEAVK